MTFSTFLVALVAFVGLAQCQRVGQGQDACQRKVMDIFFILDSSSSIYVNDYLSQHRITRQIIERFDISDAYTRVGLLTYSDEVERPVIGLNQYPNRVNLANAITIQTLPYRTGTTNSHLAIRYVRQLNEFRNDITKVIVVMTDGGSREPASTSREAELARAAGFYLFVVGIGQYLEEREWRSIASDPDDSFIFNISNPRLLNEVQFSLPARACELPPIVQGGSCTVSRRSDLYFVGGRSTSSQSVDIINAFTRRTRDSRNLLRASYLIDGCSQVDPFSFDANGQYVCERIDPNSGRPVTSRTVSELLEAAVTSVRDFARPNQDSNPVIVLVLDDDVLSRERFELANQIRNAEGFDNVNFLIVDIGLRTYRDFARRLSQKSDNVVAFNSGSASSQSSAQSRFINSACRVVNDVAVPAAFSRRNF